MDLHPASQWIDIPDEDLTIDHIRGILEPIEDDVWVAAACIDRVVENVDVQRVLLEFGAERTQKAVERVKNALLFEVDQDESEDVGVADSKTNTLEHYLSYHPPDAQIIYIRAVLLGRLDRLNTYVELMQTPPVQQKDGWEDDPWATGEGDDVAEEHQSLSLQCRVDPQIPLSVFLTRNLYFIASALAVQSNFEALELLIQRHQPQLSPFRSSLLECIPEYAHPSDYRNLLPAIDVASGTEATIMSRPWRTALDWSETPERRTALEVQRWYKDRVEFLISSAGLVDEAISLVQHGVSHGVTDLDELGEDLGLISRLVYDAPRPLDHADVTITWNDWASMKPSEVIRKYLAFSRPITVVSDIQRLVLPYLFVLESRCERTGKPDPHLKTRLLYEYVLNAPLEIVGAIFEASKPTLVQSRRLISDDEDMARLALACLYGSNSLDEWRTMSQIFECLPAWNLESLGNDEDEADTVITSLGTFLTPTTARPHCTPSDLLVFFSPLPARSLSRSLDILDVHLESGEILARWRVPAPLRWFLQSANGKSQQRAWATKMARNHTANAKKLRTEDGWLSLLDDMLKLGQVGEASIRSTFGLLSQEEIIHIFYCGLLMSGCFAIAKSMFAAQYDGRMLTADSLEELCLTCSREFYDNASSGNVHFGDMKLAYDCLSVIPASPKIDQEREFIEATSRICSFNVMSRPGVVISPIEIRLTKDKLGLVSRVLSSNESAYKHTEVILDLMRKLGFRDNVAAEVKTLAMVADAALQAEDFARAVEMSERMVNTVLNFKELSPLGADSPDVKAAIEVCWVACYQLGRQPEFDDTEKKMMLLGRALELCPPENIVEILTAWRRTELADIEDRRTRISTRRMDISGHHMQNGPRERKTTTLAGRLQNLRVHNPLMSSAPDAAAMASQAFNRVAATFPFSVRGRTSEQRPRGSRESSEHRTGSPPADVQSHARHAFQRGIGWLIGADDDEL
ncbi:Sec39-domain-containing protein [Rickenella mellea]|uniref:Sec39-domain-containing protein n=1 Tax=Rickenella mellea TaxID=50990 RepID=A0A4Y7QLP6_9AGAM|nr:Sec39-domain-containing protein [Rickenella mellea]